MKYFLSNCRRMLHIIKFRVRLRTQSPFSTKWLDLHPQKSITLETENETITVSLISRLHWNLTITIKNPDFIKAFLIKLEQEMPTGYSYQFLVQPETIFQHCVSLLRNITPSMSLNQNWQIMWLQIVDHKNS